MKRYIKRILKKKKNIFFSSLDTLAHISVVIPNDEIVKNKFIEFFNVNKNNYSLRSLFIKLNNNINVGEIFKNIDKFRVLESFVVKDSIKNINDLFNLVENISKIHTINCLKLFYLGKLSSEEQKNISQYSQNIIFVDINKEKEGYCEKGKLKIYEIDEKYESESDSLFILEY